MTAPGRRVTLWGPVVAYMAAIFLLSADPSPPAPPGVSDKLLHGLAYAGLALVSARATSGGHLRTATVGALLAAWGIATVYGATDEFHQRFTPGRHADVMDLLADAAGAAAGLCALRLYGILLASVAPSRR